MATPCTPLKIQIAYLDSQTPKTLLFTRKKVLDLLHKNEITFKLVQFWLILPKFRC